MSWKGFLVNALVLCFTIASYGQANILNAKDPKDIGKKTEAQKQSNLSDKPLEYGYVEERDILWSKVVWEIIDLDERVNFPLYYPIDVNNIGSNRKSLYNVLIDGIKSGKIEKIYADSYFNDERSLKDIEATLSKVDTTNLGIEQYNAGEEVDAQFIDRRDLGAADIAEYHIRGMWYFDKRMAELRYRILGIAPVAPDVNFIDSGQSDLVELFWVWFPDAREVLNDNEAYTGGNNSDAVSFDHLLNSRRFNATIYKEDNVYGNREIDEYIADNAFMELLEAQRIKEQIRNFELDMWNY
ncbi:protein involved in gliding motility GldN [Salegentibacter echinorum]|uniref:Protein involved in gliding motility GldN n=1 Tax=Salegentibacter echinorum TaxID=1073325 RepID=A0A1M5I9A9_SALEC|nr:gliding motility protein GldN [Salegentibacter echinorum]SHG24831.1 protein involved in gliding motility GldN [Salegentibacter echinorum]